LRRRGVVTSTFGLGADFDERLLQQMADAGEGHFYFIDSAVQIPDVLASELGESLEVVASGVTLAIESLPGVEVEVLNQFTRVREPGRVVVQLGDLVSDQELALVARLVVPTGGEGSHIAVTFRVDAADGRLPGQSAQQIWTYAAQAANDAQPRNQIVDEAVGEIYAARARAEAVEFNRRGDFEGAARVLNLVARKIEAYAGSNAPLRQIVVELRQAIEMTAEAMSPVAMKAMHFGSGSSLRGRTADGKARRRPKVM
jgi:Ca-activated chloride channel family protein